MKNWIENKMGTIVKKFVKNWQTDFFDYDVPKLLDAGEGIVFLWEVRETGTYLCVMDEEINEDSLLWFRAVIEAWPNSRFYRGTVGGKLKKISSAEAAEIIRKEIKRINEEASVA